MWQYNQAEHTPFGSGYLAELGEHASSLSAELILQGNFQPAVKQIILPETLAIIQKLGMKMKLAPTDIKPFITTEEFIATYKAARGNFIIPFWMPCRTL
jgi:hypothetical protein